MFARMMLLCAIAAPFLFAQSAFAASDVVISQIYPGGGVSNASYRSDFIELFNRGGAAVDLTGWSVQCASGSGSTWQVTPLTGAIAPGQYYLIREFTTANGLQNLPTPDATGTINIDSFSGKVALVSNATALSGQCPLTSAVDFVGYQLATMCYEGAPVEGGVTSTQAWVRQGGGCTDSDDNFQDFRAGTPNPRNTAAPIVLCAQRGACCHDQLCTLETAAACTSLAGTYQGEGSTCAGCPPLPCRTLADARSLTAGSPLRLCGVVVSSTTDLESSSAEKSFQIQDATAGGIVHGSNAAIDQLLSHTALGHDITIEGFVAYENAAFVLHGPYTFVIDGGFAGTPAPQTVTSADFQGSAGANYESELVTVQCVYFANNLGEHFFIGGFYTVRDPLGAFRILTLSAELNGVAVPASEAAITGIFRRSNSSFSLAPRTPADFVVSSDCAPFGACCLPTPECVLETEPGCTARNGVFQGAHTECSTDPCHLPCFGRVRGDTNFDGVVNLFDIDTFAVALAHNDCGVPGCLCNYDCNCDGVLNNFDIDAFVRCLTNGCPTCSP